MHSGFEYRTVSCLGDPDEIDLHIVRFDARQWVFDTAVAKGSNARAIARRNDAPFVINANFFDRARSPLGVIVQSGEIVQKPRTTDWQSIFLVTEAGRPRIIKPEDWSKYRDEAWMAVQAGPRLVVSGKKISLRANYAAPRAGVCIQWDRDLLFFAMPPQRKLHTTEIARVAARKEVDGGLECRDAMLFDGGHSVNFFVKGEDENVSISGDPVPVFVYAKEK